MLKLYHRIKKTELRHQDKWTVAGSAHLGLWPGCSAGESEKGASLVHKLARTWGQGGKERPKKEAGHPRW